LIIGKRNASAIGTLVERSSGYLILVHVPTGRPTAAVMREGIIAALRQLPVPLRRTLTWDSHTGDAPGHQRTDRHPGVLLRRPQPVAAR